VTSPSVDKSLQQPKQGEAADREELKQKLDQMTKERDSALLELKKKTEEYQRSREADRSRLASLLSQYKAIASNNSSSTSSSPCSSSSSSLSVIKKADLSELKLLAHGGSKAVHRCLFAKSPAVYYCYLAGESSLKDSSKIVQEFKQEVDALTKPALLQHPNILKILAVRWLLGFCCCSPPVHYCFSFCLSFLLSFFSDCIGRAGFRG
jgi:hypothetical protein